MCILIIKRLEKEVLKKRESCSNCAETIRWFRVHRFRQVLLLDRYYLCLAFSKNVYTCLGGFKPTELKVLFAGQSPGSDLYKLDDLEGFLSSPQLPAPRPPSPASSQPHTCPYAQAPALHSQVPTSRHRAEEGGVLSLLWCHGAGLCLTEAGEKNWAGFYWTHGTAVLVVMFYNAGI